MRDHEWKAGERVARSNGGWRTADEIITIDRVTPSGLPVIGPKTYRKDGGERGSARYYGTYIKPLTPELEAEIVDERRKVAAWRAYQLATDKIRHNTLPADALERIAALINAEVAHA